MASTTEMIFTFLAFGLIVLVGFILQNPSNQPTKPTKPTNGKSNSLHPSPNKTREQFHQVMSAIDSLHLNGFVKGKHSSRWKVSQDIRITFSPKYAYELSLFRLGNSSDRKSSMSGFFNIDYVFKNDIGYFNYEYDYTFVRIGRGSKDRVEKKGSGKGADHLSNELNELRNKIFNILDSSEYYEELYFRTREIKQIHDNCCLWTSMSENKFILSLYDPITEKVVSLKVSFLELGYMNKNGRRPEFFTAVVVSNGAIYKNTIGNIKKLTDTKTLEEFPTAVSIRKGVLDYVSLRANSPKESYSFKDSIIPSNK